MDDYQKKMLREQQWHTANTLRSDHFLNSRLCYSRERQAFNYRAAKSEMAAFLEKIVLSCGLSDPSILISPVGDGADIEYVEQFSSQITGIDISQAALDQIRHRSVKTILGDMKHMDLFPDHHFDIVLAPLFFHHFRGAYDEFLRELLRVLKPGGHLITLEPSILHPVSWLTRSLRAVVGNITGQVEDEGPLMPFRLSRAMRRCGFEDIQVRGASFSHNRLPIWLARIANTATRPLLGMPLVKHFAWLCIFYGRKPWARRSWGRPPFAEADVVRTRPDRAIAG